MIRALLLTVLLTVLLTACSTVPTSAPATPSPPSNGAASVGQRSDISVQQLNQAMAGGAVGLLVDVRTPAEFASGHVPGAVNIPLDVVGQRVDELKSRSGGTVHLVCRSGGRSSRAADLLARSGLNTVNVEGGTLAWTASGLPTE